MQKLKLYHYWRSSSSWRVRWGLALKDVKCEFEAIDLLSGQSESPEHLSRNPLGFVPVLEITESSGKKFFLSESLPILEWLNETYPEPSLFPKDPIARARARQLAEVINAGTQPLQNLNVQELHSADKEAKKHWSQHWIRNGLHAYETLVRETAGKFSVGNELSVADLCLIPQCYNCLLYT